MTSPNYRVILYKQTPTLNCQKNHNMTRVSDLISFYSEQTRRKVWLTPIAPNPSSVWMTPTASPPPPTYQDATVTVPQPSQELDTSIYDAYCESEEWKCDMPSNWFTQEYSATDDPDDRVPFRGRQTIWRTHIPKNAQCPT
jgi:hypothetical protein